MFSHSNLMFSFRIFLFYFMHAHFLESPCLISLHSQNFANFCSWVPLQRNKNVQIKKHYFTVRNKKKKTIFTSKLDLNLRKKLVKCYIWSIALYGAETWTLLKADQKYLESFEMWCWRRMEISWTDRVRNEVLHRVKEERNIVHTIKRRKAN